MKSLSELTAALTEANREFLLLSDKPLPIFDIMIYTVDSTTTHDARFLSHDETPTARGDGLLEWVSTQGVTVYIPLARIHKILVSVYQPESETSKQESEAV